MPFQANKMENSEFIFFYWTFVIFISTEQRYLTIYLLEAKT